MILLGTGSDIFQFSIINYHLIIKKQLKKVEQIKNLKMAIKIQSGFTMIETLLYIAIISVIVTSFVLYGWNIIQGGAKSSHQEEVSSTARYVSQRIKYEIRNASAINSVSATEISLAEIDSAKNPTVISFATGQITVKQGTGATVAINPSSTNISSFVFTNYSSGDSKTKNVQFAFTIESNYPSIGNVKDSLSIEGDAELRSN